MERKPNDNSPHASRGQPMNSREANTCVTISDSAAALLSKMGATSNARGKRKMERLLSIDSASEAKELVDSDSISLPLSLIKGLRRKSSSLGVGSSSSNGGGSGNNSDNSALVSLGNNSFGFNFDSEEAMLNGSSPNNSEADGKIGESDSDGNGPVEVTSSSSMVSKGAGSSSSCSQSQGMNAVRLDPPGQGSTQQAQMQQQQQHMPPVSKPSSSSLNSQRSGNGSSDSGSGSNGNGGSSGSKSTVSSLTSATMSSNGNSNFTSSSHEAAAAAAVANLQSIANAYSSPNTEGKGTKNNQQRAAAQSEGKVTSKKSGRKRKAEDDEDDDSGGYNSDDEGGCAASRAPLNEAVSLQVPDATASSSAATTATSSSNTIKEKQPLVCSPNDSLTVGDHPTVEDAVGDGGSRKKSKKVDENKREERNAREKERSFRISRQINELRDLLSSGGVIVPKGTKSSVLTEAANYIRMLQQHQYRSEIDRHQLVQQMQMIGNGALGPQAAGAVRHVAAQNGVWSLGNFGGVPPRSAMTPYQQAPFAVPVGTAVPSAPQQQQQQAPMAPLVSNIEEHEYRYVFNSCSVGMAIASMGGAFIDCNQLFCQLSNYTKQEVCSMTIFNLTSRQDLQRAFDLISQMISPPADGQSVESSPCVLRGSMKHGNDLGLSVSLIKGDDGIAKCFCVTLIKNPASPFDPSRPIPATADMVVSRGSQIGQVTDSSQKSQSSSSLTSPAYTTG